MPDAKPARKAYKKARFKRRNRRNVHRQTKQLTAIMEKTSEAMRKVGVALNDAASACAKFTWYPSAVREGTRDALNVQCPEPKLLTADELFDLPRTSIVWIEYWCGEKQCSDGLIAGLKCADGTIVDEDTCVYSDFEDDMKPDAEGSRWRFWSAEPSEELRKETPWDG